MKSLNQRNKYTAISFDMIVSNLNWKFLIAYLLWEPLKHLEITLPQIQINMLLRKQKFYEGIKIFRF